MEVADILKSKQIQPGVFFTVKRWKHGNDDRTYRGELFEVLVYDRPFIRAKVHEPHAVNKVVTLDSNDVEIMALSPEFVSTYEIPVVIDRAV